MKIVEEIVEKIVRSELSDRIKNSCDPHMAGSGSSHL